MENYTVLGFRSIRSKGPAKVSWGYLFCSVRVHWEGKGDTLAKVDSLLKLVGQGDQLAWNFL